jgi:hypothetical protein
MTRFSIAGNFFRLKIPDLCSNFAILPLGLGISREFSVFEPTHSEPDRYEKNHDGAQWSRDLTGNLQLSAQLTQNQTLTDRIGMALR